MRMISTAAAAKALLAHAVYSTAAAAQALLAPAMKNTAASQSTQWRASGSLPMQASHHRKLQGCLVSVLACLDEACGRPAKMTCENRKNLRAPPRYSEGDQDPPTSSIASCNNARCSTRPPGPQLRSSTCACSRLKGRASDFWKQQRRLSPPQRALGASLLAVSAALEPQEAAVEPGAPTQARPALRLARALAVGAWCQAGADWHPVKLGVPYRLLYGGPGPPPALLPAAILQDAAPDRPARSCAAHTWACSRLKGRASDFWEQQRRLSPPQRALGASLLAVSAGLAPQEAAVAPGARIQARPALKLARALAVGASSQAGADWHPVKLGVPYRLLNGGPGPPPALLPAAILQDAADRPARSCAAHTWACSRLKGRASDFWKQQRRLSPPQRALGASLLAVSAALAPQRGCCGAWRAHPGTPSPQARACACSGRLKPDRC